jgi:hypothetical protein
VKDVGVIGAKVLCWGFSVNGGIISIKALSYQTLLLKTFTQRNEVTLLQTIVIGYSWEDS